MGKYTYRVVTSNGHGVHSREFKRCSDAKEHAAHRAQHTLGPYEIERIENLDGGRARRYQLRSRSRWVQWHPEQDAAIRKPDWIYGCKK